MALFRRKKAKANDVVDPTLLASAKGNDKEVLVYPNRVVIRAYKGKRVHWEKTIRINAITAIQFRPPGRANVGYLQVIVSGSGEERRNSTWDTLLDENTIHFGGKELPIFQRVRDVLDQLLFPEPTAAVSTH